MKTIILHAGAVAILFGVPLGAATAFAQAPAGPQAAAPSSPAAQAAPSTPSSPSAKPSESSRADAYYYFMIGHLQEQEYEASTSADMAEQSIGSYKKALELDPDSTVVKERLAEIYAKSRHIRDAVVAA